MASTKSSGDKNKILHEKQILSMDVDLTDEPASRMAATRHLFNESKHGLMGVELGSEVANSDVPFARIPRTQLLTTHKHKYRYDDDDDVVPSEPVHQLGQYKGVNVSIEVSDTFDFDNPKVMELVEKGMLGSDEGYFLYSRSCNPTVLYLASYIASMEGTKSAYCTSSGMSAITAAMIHLCKFGSHVVCSNAIYAGTRTLLTTFLPEKCNVTTTFVDITNHKEVDDAIEEGKTNVLYFETVSNPELIVADIPALSKIAHNKKVTVVVDNTFTPMIITPAKYGADVVVQSLTKYVSGGADIIAGAICGSHELIENLISFTGGALLLLGPTLNPKEAFELIQRMSHMSIRVKEQCKRSIMLAQHMKNELGVDVIYPGLEDHPQYGLISKLKNRGYGYGAMLCVDMKTTDKAFELLTNLKKHKFGFMAVSLGYYENLISFAGPDDRKHGYNENDNHKVSPGLVRMSIGYLDTFGNKWTQFKNAYLETNKNLIASI